MGEVLVGDSELFEDSSQPVVEWFVHLHILAIPAGEVHLKR
jgi:hypothetical protein